MLLTFVGLASCALFDASPLTVTSWSPREERLSTVNGVVIQVRFSRPVNVVLTEQAFSITADDATLPGRVSWADDSTLVFTPDEPLRDSVVYSMHVSTQAEDTQGRDLQPPFNHTFSTRTDFSRPSVVSTSPPDHAAIADLLTPLVVTFSKRMDPASVYPAFSLSPAVTGLFSLSPDGTTMTYTPTQQLQWQTRYTLTVAASAADTQRNTLGADFTSHFTVGTDSIPPAIVSLQRADDLTPLVADSPLGMTIAQDWEATAGLIVTFSEPVLTTSALAAISLSPPVDFKVQERNSSSTATLTYSFPSRLAYGTTYAVFVGSGIQDTQGNRSTGQAAYHFIVSGSHTRPPVVAHVYFPLTPGDPSPELTAYSSITLPAVDTQTDRFFDLYIDHAEAASLDPLVVSQAFSVSVTNGAADISPFAVQSNPAVIFPAVSGPDQSVVRVWVFVTNQIASGQVVIRVSTALVDSSGNALAREFVLPLKDPN